MNTYFGLLAEFGTAHVPLVTIAKNYFGMDATKAKRLAATRQFPIPTFRLGGQKSPWLIAIDDLAMHLDEKKLQARSEFNDA